MSTPITGAQSEEEFPSSSSHTTVVDGESLTVPIIRAIARARDEDPGEVDVQLYEYIDPEALDRLSDHASTREGVTWDIEFTVEDVDVTVRSDGRVVATT